MRNLIVFSLLSLGLLSSCGDKGTVTPPTPLSDKFSAIQTQTLNRTCAISGCHIGTSAKAFLNLDDSVAYKQLTSSKIQNDAGAKRFKALVVSGKPDSSFLVHKLLNPITDEGSRMPERLPALSSEEITAIKSWITRGAPND